MSGIVLFGLYNVSLSISLDCISGLWSWLSRVALGLPEVEGPASVLMAHAQPLKLAIVGGKPHF